MSQIKRSLRRIIGKSVRMKIYCHSWLLTAMALLSFATAQGGTIAQTDLASIMVTPLTRQAGARADWQTIYDYAGGGALPPGTRVTSAGKWIDPIVRQDQSGVTFAFPDLPDNPENSQYLKIAFAFDRPIADYPTRATIRYTSFFDQTMPKGSWSPFLLLANYYNERSPLFGHIGHIQSPSKSGLKPVGDNTLVFSLGGKSATSITMNGQDATAFFSGNIRAKGLNELKPGAMLLNGLALFNTVTQFPHNKGDWFAVRSFKIEQMRPSLEASSEAAVDLTVPGSEPVRVTIEVVDAKNDSMGYVLRDALVAPGKYRLYWDGIDQNSIYPQNTAWVGAGSYTFRLTTSKTAVHYAGEINNSGPKYTTKSYDLVTATALAMACLQGLTSRKQPCLWLNKSAQDCFWLNWHVSKKHFGGYDEVADWKTLFRQHAEAFHSTVIPDATLYRGDLPAANVAACEDLIVATPELTKELGLPIKVDLRGRFTTFAADSTGCGRPTRTA